MTDVISAVPVYDITVPKGATRIVRFNIAKDGVNFNLSLPGTQVIFTVKDNDDAATPLIQKAYCAAHTDPHPGVRQGGIAVSQITVGEATVWVADVTLDPADTEQVARTLLPYDLWLLDLAQEAPCAQGTLKLAPTVLRP